MSKADKDDFDFDFEDDDAPPPADGSSDDFSFDDDSLDVMPEPSSKSSSGASSFGDDDDDDESFGGGDEFQEEDDFIADDAAPAFSEEGDEDDDVYASEDDDGVEDNYEAIDDYVDDGIGGRADEEPKTSLVSKLIVPVGFGVLTLFGALGAYYFVLPSFMGGSVTHQTASVQPQSQSFPQVQAQQPQVPQTQMPQTGASLPGLPAQAPAAINQPQKSGNPRIPGLPQVNQPVAGAEMPRTSVNAPAASPQLPVPSAAAPQLPMSAQPAPSAPSAAALPQAGSEPKPHTAFGVQDDGRTPVAGEYPQVNAPTAQVQTPHEAATTASDEVAATLSLLLQEVRAVGQRMSGIDDRISLAEERMNGEVEGVKSELVAFDTRLSETDDRVSRIETMMVELTERKASNIPPTPTPRPDHISKKADAAAKVAAAPTATQKKAEEAPRNETVRSDYVLRGVSRDKALVQASDDGQMAYAMLGMATDGIGRAISIEKRGGKWVLVTSEGLIVEN